MDFNWMRGPTTPSTTTNTPATITTSGCIPYNTTTDTSDSSCTIGGMNPLLVLYTSAAATCLASLTIGFYIHRQFFANRMIRNALRNTAAVLGISTRDTRINIEGVRAIEEFDKEIEREFKSFKVSLKSVRKKHLTQSNFELEILSSIRTSVNSIVALGRTINPSNNYKVEAYQREFEKYLDAVCSTQEKLHTEYHKKIDARVRGDCMKKAWQLLQTCPHATHRQQKSIQSQIIQQEAIGSNRAAAVAITTISNPVFDIATANPTPLTEVRREIVSDDENTTNQLREKLKYSEERLKSTEGKLKSSEEENTRLRLEHARKDDEIEALKHTRRQVRAENVDTDVYNALLQKYQEYGDFIHAQIGEVDIRPSHKPIRVSRGSLLAGQTVSAFKELCEQRISVIETANNFITNLELEPAILTDLYDKIYSIKMYVYNLMYYDVGKIFHKKSPQEKSAIAECLSIALRCYRRQFLSPNIPSVLLDETNLLIREIGVRFQNSILKLIDADLLEQIQPTVTPTLTMGSATNQVSAILRK